MDKCSAVWGRRPVTLSEVTTAGTPAFTVVADPRFVVPESPMDPKPFRRAKKRPGVHLA